MIQARSACKRNLLSQPSASQYPQSSVGEKKEVAMQACLKGLKAAAAGNKAASESGRKGALHQLQALSEHILKACHQPFDGWEAEIAANLATSLIEAGATLQLPDVCISLNVHVPDLNWECCSQKNALLPLSACIQVWGFALSGSSLSTRQKRDGGCPIPL